MSLFYLNIQFKFENMLEGTFDFQSPYFSLNFILLFYFSLYFKIIYIIIIYIK